jgi:hypothetical protein
MQAATKTALQTAATNTERAIASLQTAFNACHQCFFVGRKRSIRRTTSSRSKTTDFERSLTFIEVPANWFPEREMCFVAFRIGGLAR